MKSHDTKHYDNEIIFCSFFIICVCSQIRQDEGQCVIRAK